MKFFNRSNPSKVIFHDKMFCEECVETREEEVGGRERERESTLKGIKAKEKGIPKYNSWDCAQYQSVYTLYTSYHRSAFPFVG